MMRRTVTLALLATALTMPGCARYYYGEQAVGTRTDLLEANYRAADRLLLSSQLDPRRSVLVSTIVNVDRLNESSRLGRLFSEQIAGRLVQRGVSVTEVRLREQLALQSTQGELLLSRELREVSQTHDAQAVLVGTYAVSGAMIYVSLKLVNPLGNQMVAASDYALPMDDNIRGLLHGR